MKYALFALGLLLMLIGAFLVYMGSGIIEVERGWSSVLAGTMAFVGGLLTLGIAWIIKTLEQLHAALKMREAAAVGGAVPQAYGAGDDFARTSETPIPPMTWPPHTAPALAATEDEDNFDNVPPTTEPVPPPVSFEHNFYSSITAESEETFHAETKPRSIPEPTKASPSIKELWRRVAKEIDTTGPVRRFGKDRHAEPPPMGTATPPPRLPVMPEAPPFAYEHEDTEAAVASTGDWLDQAFADLDTPRSGITAPAAHEAPEAAEAESYPDLHMQEPEPPIEAPEDELPPTAAAEPAIIGRYEAEGTSYTMFADGSIEAQSERGVARFKSMADLKAYFETQETA
ncbi:MAG: hypothetical protein ACYC5H_10225 [Methylovirgula sp.]